MAVNLPISCCYCGAQQGLMEALEDADGRRFMDVITDVQPVVIRPLMRYLYLFKPAQQGMRWSRMYKLVQEIAPMIKDAKLQRDGTTYTVPPQSWADAMMHLVETPPKTLKLPLKSHGYLLEILASGAEKAAGQQESRAIEQKRNRGRDGSTNKPVQAIKMASSKPPGSLKELCFGKKPQQEDQADG